MAAKNSKLMICPKRSKTCKDRKCKGAYKHKCEQGNEIHGCILYISQPFCEYLS